MWGDGLAFDRAQTGPIAPAMTWHHDKSQVALNKLSRVLSGHCHTDLVIPTFSTADLYMRTSLPTMNEVNESASALNAWKARNGGTLSTLLASPSSSRRANQGQVIVTVRTVAAVNMWWCWMASSHLRGAGTIGVARAAAKELGKANRLM